MATFPSLTFLSFFFFFFSQPLSLHAFELSHNETSYLSVPGIPIVKLPFSISLWPFSLDSPLWHNILLIALAVTLYETQFLFLWFNVNKLKSGRVILLCLKLTLKTVLGAILTLFLIPILTPIYSILSGLKRLAMRVASFRFGKSYTEPNGNDIIWVTKAQDSQPMISALLKCEGELDLEYARKVVEEEVFTTRLKDGSLQFRKMKQTFESCCGYYIWRDSKDFNISNHIKHVDLAEVFPDEDLGEETRSSSCAEGRICKYLDTYGSVSIPAHLPQWDITCITDGNKKGFSLYFRLHHSIGDGVALMHFLLQVLSDSPIKIALLGPPLHPLVKLCTNLWALALIPFALIKAFARGKKNPLHGKSLSGKKIFVTSKGIPLDSVKAIKNSTKSTVTDVLLSCLSSSLGTFFEKRQCEVPDVMIMFPIGFEDLSAPVTLANTFGMGLTQLPTLSNHQMSSKCLGNKYDDVKPAIERLRSVKKRIDSVKEDATVVSLYWITGLFTSILPHFLIDKLFSADGLTMGVSNVPGPRNDLSLWKNKVQEMRFWVPDRAPTGAGFTMMSYKDEIRVSFSVDTSLVTSRAEAEELIDEFFVALDDLKRQVGVN